MNIKDLVELKAISNNELDEDLNVKLRPVKQSDWKFILEIRNQEAVRKACYDTSIIDYSIHEKYMKKLDNTTNCHQWIIVYNNKDVGQAKVDDLVFGYMLSPEYRGKGIWTKAYPLVLKEVKKMGYTKLKGTVKFNQKKLLEIALGLGFIKTGIRSKDGKPVGYEMEKNLG